MNEEDLLFKEKARHIQPWRKLKFQRGVVFAFSEMWTGDMGAVGFEPNPDESLRSFEHA